MKTKHWMTMTVVLVLVGLVAGCAGTPASAAGKSLRDAVVKATALLEEAQGQIDTPTIKVGDKAPKEEFGMNLLALATLDKAEKILKAAQSAYNTAKAETPEAVSPVDVSLVHRALGGVYALRGQLFYYQMSNEIVHLHQAEERVLDMLQPIRTSSVQVTSMQSRLNLTVDGPAKLKREATAAKAAADKTIQTSTTTIATLKADIAGLETKIRDTNTKATSLRTESGLTNTKAAQLKLREAQAFDKQAAAFAFAIEKNQFEILKNQAAIQIAKVDLTAATKIIADAVAMTTARTKTVAAINTEIAAGQGVVKKHATECAASLATFDTHLVNLQALAGKAISAYQTSAEQFLTAQKGVWKTLEPQILSEQGDALAQVGNLNSELLGVRKQVTIVTKRLATTWEALSDDAPTAPASKQAAAFLTQTTAATAAMTEAYTQAIAALKEARDTAGQTRQWAFEANLAEAHLDYAAALNQSGNTSEATNQVSKAQQLWSTIQQGAEAVKRTATIQALKKRLGK